MNFESLGLSQSLLTVLEKQNYKTPTPIQTGVIPSVLKGKDVLGIAKTGSGKTASYVLPILEGLFRGAEGLFRGEERLFRGAERLFRGAERLFRGAERHGDLSVQNKRRAPFVLVLVPTRELAVQVNDVFKLFALNISPRVKSMAVFGGVSINPQMKALNNVNILVATPGRLLKLVESKAVHLDEVETLVLDEADKILNEGFAMEVNKIFELLPKKRQNLLFSATLNDDISSMNQVLLKNPEIIKIEFEDDDIELIKQVVYFVEEEKKGPLLRYLIISQNMKQVLIFTSSVAKANRVAEKLRRNGVDAMAIHKKKSQGVRTDLLTKFKHGKLNVLVATDLLARGIDIELLPYVINYELPRSPKIFIHRIGRTGRAEVFGEAISLVTPSEEHHFKIIEKKMKKRVKSIDITDLNLHGF